MKLVVIVPVRGGSRGLPGKNLAVLAGVPLWQRAVSQGVAVGADEVIVTTDVEDILAGDAGAKVRLLRRPADLAGDATPMAPVMMHALRDIDGPARIVLLQPTSPLRTLDDIRSAIELHESGQFELVKSVTEANAGVLKYGRMDGDKFVPLADPAFCFSNRQDLPPVLRPNGAVYVFDRDWFLQNEGFVSDAIGAVVMPEDRSHDIDTAEDFARAEAILTV